MLTCIHKTFFGIENTKGSAFMSYGNDIISKTRTVNEIIDNASVLPIECQEWLLAIAKGMAFTNGVRLPIMSPFMEGL